jgi:ribosomal protein S18 acetylase RimI-like enzyme
MIESSGYTIRTESYPLRRQTISSLLLLLENNMRALYERSSWGWNRELKRSELCDPETVIISLQQYCTTRQTDEGRIIGFVSFQFSQEPLGTGGALVPAVYCYELQLEASHRNLGLGRALINLMETIGRQRYGAVESALSVFRFNTAAVRFYLGCGYRELSPADGYSNEGEEDNNNDDDDILVLHKPLAIK